MAKVTETSRRKQTISSDYLRYEFEGNAVRQTAIPEEIPAEEPIRRRKKTREERMIEENYIKSSTFNLKTLAIVTMMTLLVIGSCVRFVSYQSRMNTQLKTIKTLQNEYDDMVVKNNTRKTIIDAGIDYNEIYRIATEELGMTYPGKQQVLWYNSTEREYVSQYEDIPTY